MEVISVFAQSELGGIVPRYGKVNSTSKIILSVAHATYILSRKGRNS
jgi:hypothetical protein